MFRRLILMFLAFCLFAQAELWERLSFKVRPADPLYVALHPDIDVVWDVAGWYKLVLPKIGDYQVRVLSKRAVVHVTKKTGPQEVIFQGVEPGDYLFVITNKIIYRFRL